MELIIDQTKIKNMDFSTIKEYIEDNWDIGYNQLDISFSGLENDKREIFEIEEIREWVIKSIHEEKIAWFFFLSKNISSSSIKALALCYCAEPVKQDNGEIKYMPLQNKMYQFIMVNKSIMIDFCNKYDFKESLIQEATVLIDKYFNTWLGGKK